MYIHNTHTQCSWRTHPVPDQRQTILTYTYVHYHTHRNLKVQHIFMINIVSYYYIEIICKHILALHDSTWNMHTFQIHIYLHPCYIYIYVKHEVLTKNKQTYKYSQYNNRYITIACTLFIKMYPLYLFYKTKLQVQNTFMYWQTKIAYVYHI